MKEKPKLDITCNPTSSSDDVIVCWMVKPKLRHPSANK